MIAVIIPTYNRANDLRSALSSLGGQTKKEFITVVVDDASTENIEAVCDDFKPILKLVYLRNETNLGPGLSRQRGIDWAAQQNIEWLIFLDSDDLLYPNAIARLSYEASINNAYCLASQIVVEGTTHGGSTIEADKSITWMHGKIYRTKFLIDNDIHFPTNVRTNEDLSFNIQVYLVAQREQKVFYIREPLYLWRSNDKSLTRNTLIRNQCVGWDFIHAVYHACKYALAHDLIDESLLPHLISVYNYYETGVARDGMSNPEVDAEVRELLNIPLFIDTIYDANQIGKYYGCVNPCLVDEGHIYAFPESFYGWATRFVDIHAYSQHKVQLGAAQALAKLKQKEEAAAAKKETKEVKTDKESKEAKVKDGNSSN